MTIRLWYTLAILILISCFSRAAQIPTIKVKTEEVRIDMLVTDHGKPVTDLRETDFEVFDNGVPQKIEFVGFQQTPIDSILVLDMSASVAGETFQSLRDAGSRFLDALQKDERAALVTFGDIVSLGSLLSNDIKRVKEALDHATPIGDTSLIDACFAGLMLAESRSSRPLLVVFSDGLDTFSWLSDDRVLEVAKRSNAVVYAVSAGRQPSHVFLRDLCKTTGGSLFDIESTRNLGAVFLNILEEFRQRYLLTYSPLGVSKGGWHELRIQVKGRNADIKARPGYQATSRSADGE
jgi:Ca-activated chloride channel family protein